MRPAHRSEDAHLLSQVFQSARHHERDHDRHVRASVLQKSHGNVNERLAARGYCGVRLLDVSLCLCCFRVSAAAYLSCAEVNG